MKATHVRIWKALTTVLVLFMLPFASASAFVDPPTFSPAQPYAGQPIDMSVRAGVCHGFAYSPDGHPLIEIQRNENIVDAIITGIAATDPIFCMIPIYVTTFNIGTLPEGNYIVRIRIRSISNPSYPVLPPISQVSLVVRPLPPPTFVPANNIMYLLMLAWIILGSVAVRSGRVGGFFLAGFFGASMAFPTNLHAQSSEDDTLIIFELVRSEQGPNPEGIVNGFDPSAGLPPPLGALSVENPQSVQYFIPHPFRAKGDFKAYLDANPELPRARLEQMIVVRYPPGADKEAAVSALLADDFVRHAKIPIEVDLSLRPGTSDKAPPTTQGVATQYWIGAMSFPAAWARAGGWARVGVLDNGLHTDHSDLRAQDANGSLTGGNFLSSASLDIGRHGFPNPIDFNVDEMEPVPVTSASQVCDSGNGFMIPAYAGHGTHVHGLIAANHTNTDGVAGACKNCGLASGRIIQDTCLSSGIVFPYINQVAPWVGLTLLAETGTQVVNMSFGGQGNGTFDYPKNVCADPLFQNDPECLTIAYASSQGVLMVAASGNDRGRLNFPASDPRVASVGGLDESLDFWDEDRDSPPNHVDDCPFYLASNSDSECGSNYTVNAATDARQEHVAPARRVLSTLYPGMPWSPTILCDDAALGTNGDGQGPCTGTSMSAPLVSGLAGILRSINPLVLPGEGVLDPPYHGIRSVMIQSSMLPTFPDTWDPRLGYGTIRADSAVAAMLGYSDGKAMKNRLTPLFSFYGAAAKDWAHTTVPQAALAFMINQAGSYQPQGALTPGYPSFPYQYPTPPPPSPRASAYVLTTEFKVDASHPALVPLYWLDRSRPWPAGCTPGVPGCNGGNRDFLLLTSAAQVQTASNAGYDYRGLQGYVYQSCTPEPACIPRGAERLWLKCKTADDDCAVFLERDRGSFEA